MHRPWHKHYDNQVPHALYYPPVSLKDLFNHQCSLYPEKPYLILNEIAISYGAANSMARRFANALVGLGIAKGDRVAVMGPNVPQYVIAVQACFKIGAVVVPVNPLAAQGEVAHQVANAGARTIVVMARFADAPIAILKSGETALQRVVTFQLGSMPVEIEKHEGVYDFDSLLGAASDAEPGIPVSCHDTAILQYTGGTTGIPKGCVLTNYNLVATAYQDVNWLNAICQPGEGKTLAAIPLYHIYGFNCNLNVNLINGGTIICVPQPTPDNILQAVNRHEPNFFAAVPAMILGLLHHPDLSGSKMRSIRAIISGAAPLPVEGMRAFEEISGTRVIEGYGMSESCGVLTCNPVSSPPKPGTVGIPWPDNDVRIVDLEDGITGMPVGEPGELVIKGPCVMNSYWESPAETALAMREGWLYTGDIGCVDEDGFLTIVDRKKDMILVSGFNVYPRDVDEVLYTHPKVLRAAAVGVPDPVRGETVKVFVLPKPGATVTELEIIEYCRARLTRYKVPTQVEIIGELPVTNIGKIDRKALRQRRPHATVGD